MRRKAIHPVDLRNASFGLTKLEGFGLGSTGAASIKIGKRTFKFNPELGFFVSTTQKGKRKGNPVRFKISDFIKQPVLMDDIEKGTYIETGDAAGMFISAEGAEITLCDMDNNIVKTAPFIDEFYGVMFVVKYDRLIDDVKPNTCNFWDKKGKALRNEIFLKTLGIEPTDELYEKLLEVIDPMLYLLNSDKVEGFNNTLKADLEIPAVKQLFLAGEINKVYSLIIAKKLHGIGLENFNGDKEFFTKYPVATSVNTPNEVMTKKMLIELVGEIEDEGPATEPDPEEENEEG